MAFLKQFRRGWRRLRAALGPCIGGSRVYPVHIPALERPFYLAVHDGGADPIISRAIKQQGLWEAAETQAFVQLVAPGDVVVDVGANIGYFTVLAAKLVGASGRVYAFEPEEKNFALLRENVERNEVRTAHLFQAALAEADGEAELYLSDANLGDHQLYPNRKAQSRPCKTVSMRRGDHVFSDTEKIDFLKIDTQGSEGQVLKGLWDTLERSFPGLVILFELTPNALRQADVNGRDLIQSLAGVGYTFLLVHSDGLLPVSQELIGYWIDIVHLNDADERFLNVICISGERLARLQSSGEALSSLNAYDVVLGDIVDAWDGQPCGRFDVGQFLMLLGWTYPAELRDQPAEIYFKLRSDTLTPTRLRIKGAYEGAPFKVEVMLNGQHAGAHVLNDTEIEMPLSVLERQSIVVSLQPHGNSSGAAFLFEGMELVAPA